MILRCLIIVLLASCSSGGRVDIQLSRDGSHTTFDSRVVITGQSAHFACRASVSGQCHYALFAYDCAEAACNTPPLRQFAVAVGDEQTLANLPRDVRVCMRRDAGAMTAECLHPRNAATTQAPQ